MPVGVSGKLLAGSQLNLIYTSFYIFFLPVLPFDSPQRNYNDGAVI